MRVAPSGEAGAEGSPIPITHYSIPSTRLYEKVGQSAIRGDHLGLHGNHLRPTRPGPGPVEEVVDAVRVALGEQLDPPVDEVAHPPHQPGRPGDLPASLPIADTLNGPGHMDVNRFGHGAG